MSSAGSEKNRHKRSHKLNATATKARVCKNVRAKHCMSSLEIERSKNKHKSRTEEQLVRKRFLQEKMQELKGVDLLSSHALRECNLRSLNAMCDEQFWILHYSSKR